MVEVRAQWQEGRRGEPQLPISSAEPQLVSSALCTSVSTSVQGTTCRWLGVSSGRVSACGQPCLQQVWVVEAPVTRTAGVPPPRKSLGLGMCEGPGYNLQY